MQAAEIGVPGVTKCSGYDCAAKLGGIDNQTIKEVLSVFKVTPPPVWGR